MSKGHPKSQRSFKLFIGAAILLFIQTGVIFVAISMLGAGSFSNMLLWISALFGAVYLGGAFFARTGTGVTATTRQHVGGGWYENRTETANAVTCGCMAGLGSLVLSGYGIYNFVMQYGIAIASGGIPGILGSLLAIFAGLNALLRSDSAPSPVMESAETRNCPFCGKTGLSPAATACPSCGQPLQ
jgi:hypothetical protein